MENGATAKEEPFISLVRGLPANFWYANFMEILERLAFFGVRAIAPLYLVKAAGENGLGLTYTDKGSIYAWWALIQCLVPMVSGGYTERYGYRKTLAVAFIVNIIGYLGMAQSKLTADRLSAWGWTDAGYWVFLVAACLVAFGTAVFKPPCHGTIAKTTDEKTSSMGWGLFYWVVNIGGALAPMAAAQLRGEIDWHYVFYGAAIVTACNFLPCFLLYKEPEKTPPKEGEGEKGPIGTFVSSILTIFKDPRLVVFLLIFSCFWLMFMQLWDLLPNFIDEWVDSSDVAPFFSRINEGWVLQNGQTKPEMLINIDSIAIIALVLVISWLIRKINKVAAMIIGMLISLFGFVAAGLTQIGLICAIMIFVFAVGEMTCSPTFSAYVGLIAPKEKKALYMGYSNIPFAIGWALGNVAGGYFYDHYGAKATLALKYLASETKLVARAAQAADWSDALEKIPLLLGMERSRALERAQQYLGLDADATAQVLRDSFQHDQGQIENLALLHLALLPENREKVILGYTRLVSSLAEKLGGDAQALAHEISQAVKPPEEAAPEAPPKRNAIPAADEVISDADEIKATTEVARRLATGEATLDQIRLADVVHRLPAIVGKKRDEALGAVREQVNEKLPDEEKKENSEIVDMLWEELGDDPAVLNNLALEYLAQATSVVHDAVATMEFAYPPEQPEKRAKEIERRIGIGRAKAFAALSSALGRDSAEVDQALSKLNVATTYAGARVFVYLAGQKEQRYAAVSHKDWRHDLALLREMIRSDEQARQTVLAEINKVGWMERIVGIIGGLLAKPEGASEVTEEGIDYRKLASKHELIQKALSKKDWTKVPEQAIQLFGLNPFEGRALAAANDTLAKQTLWDTYHPYIVWVDLGVFGLAGTLGMVFFYFATRKSVRANKVGRATAT
jgi:POT family proton-dependent oligopeptide transporter